MPQEEWVVISQIQNIGEGRADGTNTATTALNKTVTLLGKVTA